VKKRLCAILLTLVLILSITANVFGKPLCGEVPRSIGLCPDMLPPCITCCVEEIPEVECP